MVDVHHNRFYIINMLFVKHIVAYLFWLVIEMKTEFNYDAIVIGASLGGTK